MNRSNITMAQAKAWSLLSRSYRSGRVASTYLFCGREGVGHWPLAVQFAALLNCRETVPSAENPEVFVPCGVCVQCRNIFALNFPGLHLIVPIPSHKNLGEAIDLTNAFLDEKRAEPYKLLSSETAVSIPILLAREVKQALSRKGTEGTTRVVLFYQMEKMLPSSADALLKLIEEPSPDTVIILTAERPESLLPTIQSRAQKIKLGRVPEQVTASYLREHYKVSDTRARLLARLSEGVLGQAIELASVEEDEELSRRAVGFLLFKSLFVDRNPETIGHLVELLERSGRSEAEELLRLWQSLVRDCVYYAVTGSDAEFVNVDFGSDLVKFARSFDDPKVAVAMTDRIKNTLADLRRNVHIQSALVSLSLRLKADLQVSG
ncbi:MAG: hypothetical protein AB1644_11325 [Candidatus Zixiibacteriota bacterium]